MPDKLERWKEFTLEERMFINKALIKIGSEPGTPWETYMKASRLHVEITEYNSQEDEKVSTLDPNT